MEAPAADPERARRRLRSSRVALMDSPAYRDALCRMKVHGNRENFLFELMQATGLLRCLTVLTPVPATIEEMKVYHDEDYLNTLFETSHSKHEVDACPLNCDKLEEYGLVDDCEIFEGLWEYCALVSGASLQGASMLADGSADCAINWGGGRHHGGYNKATGFCYVNDCILATLRLLKTFRRVLYLDIDVHHSDGVQRAFWTSDRVLHVSLHHLRPGFFPGTGKSSERGAGKGKGFTVNVPLAAGCGDYTFEAIFTATLNAALENFAPDCIVIQCGADTLSRDPLGPFNLSSRCLVRCMSSVQRCGKPLLVLGGGGYCVQDTARLWLLLTAAAIGDFALESLPATVPEHCFFSEYGPDFSIHTSVRRPGDTNSPEDVERLIAWVTLALTEVKRRGHQSA